MDRLFYLSYCVSLFGVLFLAYLSPSLSPPKSSVSEVDVFSVGKAVYVEGVVEDIHVFKGGSVSFVLADGNSSVNVFLPPQVGVPIVSLLEDGVSVELVGVVKQYRGSVELLVGGLEDFTIK
ncbi:MAG: OB-fold nucleic acid binding domain-containing protein [Candidatus Altiarchaeota archaeon]|nr:OB-fold nucleic acid binding domain-containing protein [Candidatus Altiarchaeota archaeon]